MEQETYSEIKPTFIDYLANRKHIEFERADLTNNIEQLNYFYTNHKEFCEYHMKMTEGIYKWNNYRNFIISKNIQ